MSIAANVSHVTVYDCSKVGCPNLFVSSWNIGSRAMSLKSLTAVERSRSVGESGKPKKTGVGRMILMGAVPCRNELQKAFGFIRPGLLRRLLFFHASPPSAMSSKTITVDRIGTTCGLPLVAA